jgi:hypothetical protein
MTRDGAAGFDCRSGSLSTGSAKTPPRAFPVCRSEITEPIMQG